MTKYIITLLVCFSFITQAQRSFEKGKNVVALGADLGIYSYTSKIASQPTSKKEAAANKIFSLHYEYGVLNWLGVGAKVQYSDYFTETDSVTNTKPSVTSVDGSVLVNAHFVRSKYVDMLAGFNIGYSHLNWDARDAYVSQAKGGGLMYDIHFQPRFYFGKYVGMYLNLAYVHCAYRDMDFQNTFTKLDDALDLVGGGVNIGIGIQAKF